MTESGGKQEHGKSISFIFSEDLWITTSDFVRSTFEKDNRNTGFKKQHT